MVTEADIQNAVVELLRKTVVRLPSDVEQALNKAYETETDEVPRMQLKAILDNIDLAKKGNTPMCQDTGVTIFYVTLPKECKVDVEKGIIEGVRRATKEVPLRPNAVHPITRKNPGDNVGDRMPYINWKVGDKDYIEITVMTKGAGSENMSALAMLTPSAGLKGIKEFALSTLLRAGSNPCPPTIIGMGIGGSSDICMKLAKEALLRPLDQRHADPEIAKLETELYEAINMLGIGPMGLGGKTTMLGLNIEYAYCHTASLPVAINVQCWAGRRGNVRIYPDGKTTFPIHEG
ncbi:MAG: fumarate hydratase [Thermoplasmata archaeon]|nr:fumarate hydratase [Thermoplasmata archaeon]MCJ7562389.1 fumarate hydratase [Thermoplasmata archaeon]TFG68226.1 MAG: fumarate hydratase [Methanomassiliicoccus sp.]